MKRKSFPFGSFFNFQRIYDTIQAPSEFIKILQKKYLHETKAINKLGTSNFDDGNKHRLFCCFSFLYNSYKYLSIITVDNLQAFERRYNLQKSQANTHIIEKSNAKGTTFAQLSLSLSWYHYGFHWHCGIHQERDK